MGRSAGWVPGGHRGPSQSRSTDGTTLGCPALGVGVGGGGVRGGRGEMVLIMHLIILSQCQSSIWCLERKFEYCIL